MLELPFIRENKEKVIKGLEKRNFQSPTEAIENVIGSDDSRKATQAELDKVLAQNVHMSS